MRRRLVWPAGWRTPALVCLVTAIVLALVPVFAGNFTLVGSVANLIVAQRAAAHGVRLDFWSYFKIGAPVKLVWKPSEGGPPVPFFALA